jgi:hypothetical protein
VVPEREFWKQVRSYFAGCGQFMQGLKGSAPGSPAAMAIIDSSVARWQGTLKQLQAQSGSINYKRVPGNDRQQTQALIESIEYLSLRFASAVQVRERAVVALDEHLLKGLGRIHDACIDSLQLISNSLAELKPIPDLPDTTSLIGEVEAQSDDLRQASATAQLRSLLEAIHDCRDKANALDWAAWNRNYF